MLLDFEIMFAPFVLDGSKTHTMRAPRRGAKWPPRVGETCHCYTGVRTKGRRLLGRWECVKVERVRITDCGGYGVMIEINDQELAPDEQNAFAWRDGFRSRGRGGAYAAMIDYWRRKSRGDLVDFRGFIIHWRFQ